MNKEIIIANTWGVASYKLHRDFRQQCTMLSQPTKNSVGITQCVIILNKHKTRTIQPQAVAPPEIPSVQPSLSVTLCLSLSGNLMLLQSQHSRATKKFAENFGNELWAEQPCIPCTNIRLSGQNYKIMLMDFKQNSLICPAVIARMLDSQQSHFFSTWVKI